MLLHHLAAQCWTLRSILGFTGCALSLVLTNCTVPWRLSHPLLSVPLYHVPLLLGLLFCQTLLLLVPILRSCHMNRLLHTTPPWWAVPSLLHPSLFFGKTAIAFHSVTHTDLDSQCRHDLLAQQHRLALLEAEVLEQECRELLAPQETPVLRKHPGGLTNEGPGTQYPSRVDATAATDTLVMQSANNNPAAAHPASPVADPPITNPPAPLVLSLTGTTSPPKVDAPVSPHDSMLEPQVDAWLHWVCTRSCARPLHRASASLATASVSASALFPTANWFALLSDTVGVTVHHTNTDMISSAPAACHLLLPVSASLPLQQILPCQPPLRPSQTLT